MFYTCGVDEAGCGALAGPVVAAAVILNLKKNINNVKDSKALTKKNREFLFEKIIANSLAFSIAESSVEEIDKLNILNATLLAMQRAVNNLKIIPHFAFIDGKYCPPYLQCLSKAIVKGDSLIPSISSASILAKVTRDRKLRSIHNIFPLYNFNKHFGYSTKLHLKMLNEYGPCIYHRQSFAPVKYILKT